MPNPDRLAEIKRRARDVFEGTGGWTMSTDRTSVSDEDIAWLIEQVEAARRLAYCHDCGRPYSTVCISCKSTSPELIDPIYKAVEAARRETWEEASKLMEERAKFLECVRNQSEGWFAISELKGFAAALRRKANPNG